VTIAVVVQETAACAPAIRRTSESGRFRHVCKGAVSVIAIEHVAPPVTDEEIVEPIIVVVADAAGLAPSAVRKAGTRGDVRECAVPVVSKQVAREFLLGIETSAVNEKDVKPAIVIEIEERNSAAHFFEQILFGRGRPGDIDCAAQTRLRSDIGKNRFRFGKKIFAAAYEEDGAA